VTKQRHDTLSTDDRAPCWFAEQQRLQDLERRYRQAERIALREILFASDDDLIEDDDDSETLCDQNDDETQA
jgi:hypothetical protein